MSKGSEKNREILLFYLFFFLTLYKILTQMLKFISFGSGSSGNCYYLSTGTDGLIIDAGVGVRTLKKHLSEYGIKLQDDVHHILITHDHADHIKAVGILSAEYSLPVYAIREVHRGIDRNYSVHKKIPSGNARVLEPGVTVSIGDFSVTPFLVPHDSTGNVGYRIVVDDVTFCLMTDVGRVTEEMQRYIGEANYLVIEANYDIDMLKNGNYPQHLKERISSGTGHLSNNDCGEALANFATSALKHAWLCHLSEENNHPVLAQKSVEQVLRSYGIIAGKDFKLEVLKRRQPSEEFILE